jgi:hypothetical protein
MALLANIPQPGRSKFAEPEYYVANRVARDRVTGNIQGKILVYRNEQTRRAHGAALSDLAAAEAAVVAASQAESSFRQTDSMPLQQDLGYLELQAARVKAHAIFAQAQRAATSADLLPASEGDFVIPPGDAAGMVDSAGAIDFGKVYAWIKARPEFAGATDA